MSRSEKKPKKAKPHTYTPEEYAEYLSRKRAHDTAMRASSRVARREEPEKLNLYFFNLIMKSCGLNLARMAKLAGCTAQRLSYWRVADNARLVDLQDLLSHAGLRLSVDFEAKESPDGVIVAEDDSFRLVGLPGWNSAYKPISYVTDCLNEDDPLYFLARYMVKNRINPSQMMRRTGIEVTSYRRMFTLKSISVKHIYKIAEAYGLKVVWTCGRIDEVGDRK